MNLLRKIDSYFLCDEDETAPLSEKILYYGMLNSMLIFSAIITYKIINF